VAAGHEPARLASRLHGGGTPMTGLILKRAPIGWNQDDFDVIKDSVVVGRIFKVPIATGPHLDVGERPQRANTPSGARSRTASSDRGCRP
jgi:hypothetical protein